MLSRQHRAEFAGRGVVAGAFAGEDAARMRQRVWARLARFGVTEDGPATWAAAHVTGLSKAIERDAVFTAAGPPAQDRWRAAGAPHHVALARAGATFINGKLAGQPAEAVA